MAHHEDLSRRKPGLLLEVGNFLLSIQSDPNIHYSDKSSLHPKATSTVEIGIFSKCQCGDYKLNHPRNKKILSEIFEDHGGYDSVAGHVDASGIAKAIQHLLDLSILYPAVDYQPQYPE